MAAEPQGEPEPEPERDDPPEGMGVWQDLETLKALMHPLRMRAYVEAVKGPVSAKELSDRLDVPIQRMSYHVRLLADAGLFTVARKTPRRGAVETHYRAVATLEVDDDALVSSPELVRAWYHVIVRLLAEDVEYAIEQGSASPSDFILGRAHFAVDAAGRERVRREILDFYGRLAELEQELRVAPEEATDAVNFTFTVHPGRRDGGRNGPMITQVGHDWETIPPD